VCSYDNKEFIDKDTVMLSLGKSNIKDNNLCDISPNFIVKAADLLYYYSLLLSFEDILA
jgi:hypothetical protein